MTEPAAENELLQRAARGEREAYALLYTRYTEALYRYIYLFTGSREQSEEIVQDVFVRVWEKNERLLQVKVFKSYLFKTAKNLLIDQVRRQKVELQVKARASYDREKAIKPADLDLIYDQYRQIASDAIGRLPRKRKQIFELRNQEGLSLDEIASQLAISKSVVKKQLYAATAFVKEYLRKHGEMTISLCFFLIY